MNWANIHHMDIGAAGGDERLTDAAICGEWDGAGSKSASIGFGGCRGVGMCRGFGGCRDGGDGFNLGGVEGG